LNTDLQTLIGVLEEEKLNLLQLIDSSVKDQEYIYAHSHFKALKQINRRLQTLKNLEDKLYDEKYFKEESIKRLKKELESDTYEGLKSMLSRMIANSEEELRKLKEKPKEAPSEDNHHIISDHLDLVVTKKILGFRLVLNGADDLSLEIRRSNGSMKLTLPHIKKLKRNYILSRKKISKLKALGFQLPGKEEKLVLNIPLEETGLRQKISIILSVIVFEVFYFKELGGKSYIEVLRRGASSIDG
jgi:hypothetical protein